jgi:hypothetical protein
MLGWRPEEAEVLFAGCRAGMRDSNVHAYGLMHFWSGQKPKAAGGKRRKLLSWYRYLNNGVCNVGSSEHLGCRTKKLAPKTRWVDSVDQRYQLDTDLFT